MINRSLLSRILLVFCLIIGQAGAFAHAYTHAASAAATDAGSSTDQPEPCDQCTGFAGLAVGAAPAAPDAPVSEATSAPAVPTEALPGARVAAAHPARGPPIVLS